MGSKFLLLWLYINEFLLQHFIDIHFLMLALVNVYFVYTCCYSFCLSKCSSSFIIKTQIINHLVQNEYFKDLLVLQIKSVPMVTNTL